jgi:glycosyltransferase involved in cell wall biosynthesis
MPPTKLAAIVLTKNEERDLPECLRSLSGVVSDIYVVDSGSTDRTIEIAKAHGARVLEHDFFNYATQFNWAVDQVSEDMDWVLRIDADERLTDDLRRSIQETLPKLDKNITGLLMARRTHFLGSPIRWGDTYPVWLLRIWRNKAGKCEDTWMDEHIILTHGTVERLHGDLIHEIPKNLNEWINKHNWYATRECNDIIEQQNATDDKVAGQAGYRRWLKKNVYLQLPLFVRPCLYWFYRYFIKLGFLDGKVGLMYHFLHAFWYRFLVDAKLYERSRNR